MSSNRREIAALFLINVVLLVIIAIAADRLILSIHDLRFDFYPHYVGGRAVWNGDMPYSPDVTAQIQMDMFGKLLPPDADQQNMAYPAYSSIVLGPILLLPGKAAIALWMAIQFLALLWTPVIWMQILGWRPHPLVAAGLLLGLLFGFRYAMDTFILGQFSGSVLLAISLGFWLLRGGHDRLAGIVLVAATIPPTTGGALAISILLAYGLRRRWRGLVTFAGTLLALNLVSFILIGNWIPAYLDVLRAYSGYADVPWALQVINSVPLQIVMTALLIGVSLWMLYRFVRDARADGAIDLVITALIVVLLILPQTGEYYLVLLIPALLACLYRVRDQRTWVKGIVWLSVGVIMFSPWVYPRDAVPNWPVLVIPLQTLLTWLFVNRGWLRDR